MIILGLILIMNANLYIENMDQETIMYANAITALVCVISVCLDKFS
jgi:hypothetical protein